MSLLAYYTLWINGESGPHWEHRATTVTDCLKMLEMQLWWPRSHGWILFSKKRNVRLLRVLENEDISSREERGRKSKPEMSDCSIAAQCTTELFLYPAWRSTCTRRQTDALRAYLKGLGNRPDLRCIVNRDAARSLSLPLVISECETSNNLSPPL